MRGRSKSILATITGVLLVFPDATRAGPTPQQIRSASTVRIHGFVRAETGPVKNARVSCRADGVNPPAPIIAWSEENEGRFECREVPRGANYLIEANHPDFLKLTVAVHVTQAQVDADMDIYVELRPFVLTGLAYDKTKRDHPPATDVIVRCQNENNPSAPVLDETTHNDGSFEFKPLDKNAVYALVVRDPHYQERTVRKQPRDPPVKILLDLEPATPGRTYTFHTSDGRDLVARVESVGPNFVTLSAPVGSATGDSFQGQREPLAAGSKRATARLSWSEIESTSRVSHKRRYFLIFGIVAIAAASYTTYH